MLWVGGVRGRAVLSPPAASSSRLWDVPPRPTSPSLPWDSTSARAHTCTHTHPSKCLADSLHKQGVGFSLSLLWMQALPHKLYSPRHGSEDAQDQISLPAREMRDGKVLIRLSGGFCSLVPGPDPGQGILEGAIWKGSWEDVFPMGDLRSRNRQWLAQSHTV